MRVRARLRPGAPGTKKLLERYGDRLYCVRYRYDERAKRRIKTIELIIEEGDWLPPRPEQPDWTMVLVQTHWDEPEVVRRIRRAGGVWDDVGQLWRLPLFQVKLLGLTSRIVRKRKGVREVDCDYGADDVFGSSLDPRDIWTDPGPERAGAVEELSRRAS